MFFILVLILLSIHGHYVLSTDNPLILQDSHPVPSVFLHVPSLSPDTISIYVNLENVMNTFDGATNECRRLGGSLPILHDKETLDFLVDEVMVNDDKGRRETKLLWLNMKRGDNQCSWLDGSLYDFPLPWKDKWGCASWDRDHGCPLGSCCGVTLWFDDRRRKGQASPRSCWQTARVVCVIRTSNNDIYEKLNDISRIVTSREISSSATPLLLRPQDERILFYRVILPMIFRHEEVIEEFPGLINKSGRTTAPTTTRRASIDKLEKSVESLESQMSEEEKRINRTIFILQEQLEETIESLEDLAPSSPSEAKATIAIVLVSLIFGVGLVVIILLAWGRFRTYRRLHRKPIIELVEEGPGYPISSRNNIFNVQPTVSGATSSRQGDTIFVIPKQSNVLPAAKNF